MSLNILRLPEVLKITGLSRSSIYAFCKENTFPKPIKISQRTSGWLENEISDWISQKAEQREVQK